MILNYIIKLGIHLLCNLSTLMLLIIIDVRLQ